MPSIKGMEFAFDTICADYDRWRPTYVAELYEDLFAYQVITPDSNVLEIGIGTGQATLPILKTGCTCTAVELGAHLTDFVRKKFSAYEKFQVIQTPFQDFESPSNSFDLVFSATAFHWIPEEEGYPKVFDMLRSGGAFACFANHPYQDKGREDLNRAIQEVYAQYIPGSSMGVEYGDEAAWNSAQQSKKYGFIDVEYKLYHRTRTFTANAYCSLLGTYSDHLAIEETRRREFFSKLRQIIEDHGDQITVYDTIDLQLARKP